MTQSNSRRAAMIAAAGLTLATGTAGAQSKSPPQVTPPAATMPCPMAQGGMGPGMMGGPGMREQGGGMMNWQQMHEEMQALHREMVRLREELQKRERR